MVLLVSWASIPIREKYQNKRREDMRGREISLRDFRARYLSVLGQPPSLH